MIMFQHRPIAVTAVLTAMLLAGCGTSTDQSTENGTTPSPGTATPDTASTPSAGEVPEGVAAQYATLTDEVEAEGGRTTSGDWEVAYIVEPAEPWFETTGEEPTRREPAAGETHHLEIIPIDAATGRIVPDVPIRLEVLDENGEVVDEKELMFFHAEFFHYAHNFSIPAAGEYTLRATLQPPQSPRHGESLEELTLLEPATVTFENVRLEPAA
ncbi:iron transporter [Kocuria flava]|uniref:iron transporter n=1 Tax=Kocuria flava TaxID=446860 RepID=UPI001FF5BA80|nr:iron transporter [Kocuria flava]MCJ8503771.1 iron transporter [Kocuria flava]